MASLTFFLPSAESELKIIQSVWHAISPRQQTTLSLTLYLLQDRQINAAEEGTEYVCSDILPELERVLRRNESSNDNYASSLTSFLAMVPSWTVVQLEEVRSFSGQDNDYATSTASARTPSTIIIATTSRTLATANNSSSSTTAQTVESTKTGSAISSLTADACVSDGVARGANKPAGNCSML